MDQLFFLFPYQVGYADAVNWEEHRRLDTGVVASWDGRIPVHLSFGSSSWVTGLSAVTTFRHKTLPEGRHLLLQIETMLAGWAVPHKR
jgi:hypothetical protein